MRASGATEHPIALAGQTVVARDPYSGLLARNRLFFDFSVSRPGRGGAPTGVAKVDWALDGTVVRTDDRAPYEWKGLSSSSRRMPAGDHEITVTVTPAGGGAPASVTFPLTATDCQPAYTFNSIDSTLGQRPHAGAVLTASSSYESDSGPSLTSATFTGTGVTAQIPRSARGRKAGTLTFTAGGRHSHDVVRTLRVPRRGSTLLRRGKLRVVLRPGSSRFLAVSGLPGATRDVTLTLEGAGGADLLRAHRTSRTQCAYSTGAILAGPEGRVTVDGGSSRGTCRPHH